MTREELAIGRRVWYEPSYGVRFLATVAEAPRALGSSWVVALTFPSRCYGHWRNHGSPGHVRMSCPAAAIESLFPHHASEDVADHGAL